MGSKRAAFTLVEILIVIAITASLSSLLLANFRRGQRAEILRGSAETLAINLRRLQTNALSGITVADGASALGAHFNLQQPRQYTIFGDRAKDGKTDGIYNAGEALSDGIIILPPGVALDRLEPVGPLDVIFFPPRAAVAIHPDASEVRIILKDEKTAATKAVRVNRISGQIGIE